MTTPPRPLRKVHQVDIDLIDMAIERLSNARAFLRSAGAKNAAAYVGRALKSAEGAKRHAQRCVAEEARDGLAKELDKAVAEALNSDA